MARVFKKILILAGIFLVVAIGAFFFLPRDREEEPADYQALEPATLPVVALTVENREVNVLYGYTSEMDEAYMGDTLTPLPEDRQLPVVISTYGNTVTGISYEIRSEDGTDLIERNPVADWTTQGDTVQAVIPVQDLISQNTEYRLKLLVSTEAQEGIAYYTRIIWGTEMRTSEMLDYVQSFHDATFSSEEASQYAVNLEIDGSADNGTLAHTNIHSSFDQLTWGELHPSQVGEAQIQILQMSSTFGSFLVRYEIQAEGENDRLGAYLAEEYFCLQWSAQRFYLMAYERNVSQIFEASADTISADRIEFGVIDPSQVTVTDSGKPETTSNGEKRYQVFSVGGELWSYCPENGEAVKIFTFLDESETGWRRNHLEYGVQTVNVDNQGNVEFFVYGYMNQGAHEGTSGLAYYRYVKADNALQEVFYISSDKPYQVLQEGIETLAYKSSRDLLYLKFDNNVYAVDYVGNEFVVVVENTEARGFIVNEAQDAIAWLEGENLQEADTVRILYLDSGDSHTLEAAEGEYLRTQGFIDQDCICTVGRTAEIQHSGLEDLYPQYALTITGRDGTEVSRYQYDGIYIASVEVRQGQVHLSRLSRNSSGGYDYTTPDTLMQSNAENTGGGTGLESETVDRRQRIWYLSVSGGDSGVALSVTSPNRILYGESSAMDLSQYAEGGDAERYYAYAYGHLVSVQEQAGDAITQVYDQMGWVVDGQGKRIWRRQERASQVTIAVGAEMSLTSSQSRLEGCLEAILQLLGYGQDIGGRLDAGESARAILEDLLPGSVLNLSGCTLRQLFYYLDAGTPVVAVSPDREFLLLVGYDQYNVDLYDPLSGETYKMGQNDAENYFTEAGSQYLGYVP